jgi:hypothetical protein
LAVAVPATAKRGQKLEIAIGSVDKPGINKPALAHRKFAAQRFHLLLCFILEGLVYSVLCVSFYFHCAEHGIN